MKNDKSLKTKAFTLVELSIVIVIVGLIIAGVTAGRSLVKQWQLRAVINDFNRYSVAINTFRLQYRYFPGDIPNASSYWNGATDGNGNRSVEDNNALYEDLKAWNHLSLAKLIPGYYEDGTGGIINIGVNAPKGPLRNSGYQITSYYNDVPAVYGRSPMENSIRFGAPYTGTFFNSGLLDGVISGANAYAIDVKMDDGKASLGNLLSVINGGEAADGIRCVTGAFTGAAGSSDYITRDTSDKSCIMGLWIGK